MVKIRLARHGRNKKPFYHIVAADIRCKRDGRFLEKLGTYDPQLEEGQLGQLKTESIVKWVSRGAHMTETIKSLFKKHQVQLS